MEILRQKITSEAQWSEVWGQIPEADRNWIEENLLYFPEDTSWASVREAARQRLLYSTTKALERVPGAPLLFPHISLEDRNMVAYSPDTACLLADRQVRMAPGKFFRKTYPGLSDRYVQAQTEEHIADTQMSVKFLTGKDIVEAYKECDLNGIDSCMTYADKWDVHPTSAYDVDGVALAVMINGRGQIVARCMTHTQTGRKVAIRYYGRQGLRTQLERMGYAFGDWVGVKLKAIKLQAPGTLWVMPYLDSRGGVNDGELTVPVIDGESVYMQVLPRNGLFTDRSLVAETGTTSGYVNLAPVPVNRLKIKDFTTKEEVVNATTDTHVLVYTGEDPDSTYVVTRGEVADHIVSHTLVWARLYKESTSKAFEVLCPPSLALQDTQTGDWFVKDEATLERFDFYELSEEFYGPDWYTRQSVMVRLADGSSARVLWKDAVYVVVNTSDSGLFYKDAVPGSDLLDVSHILDVSAPKAYAPRNLVCLNSDGVVVGVHGNYGYYYAWDTGRVVHEPNRWTFAQRSCHFEGPVHEVSLSVKANAALHQFYNGSLGAMLRYGVCRHLNIGWQGHLEDIDSLLDRILEENYFDPTSDLFDPVAARIVDWVSGIPESERTKTASMKELLQKYPVVTQPESESAQISQQDQQTSQEAKQAAVWPAEMQRVGNT